jgi:hypothetical protein
MTGSPQIYLIRVGGLLDPAWSEWFSGLDISTGDEDPPVTLLAGPLRDQAALRGILERIWDLNLTLISVNRVEDSNISEWGGGKFDYVA